MFHYAQETNFSTAKIRSAAKTNASESTASRLHWIALISRQSWIAAGVLICAFLLTLYTLYLGRNLFAPITVAIFAYLTLRPTVRFLSRFGIPSAVSATAVMLLLASIAAGTVYLLATPAEEMLSQIPQSMKEAKHKLSFVFDSLHTVNEATEDISNTAEEENIAAEGEPVPVEVKQPMWTTTSPIVAGTGNFVSFVSIAAVMLYFLMASGDALICDLMSAFPTFASKRRFIEILEDVQDALSSYLVWVTAINAGLGLTVGLTMWLFGMPSPLLWGIAAMLLNYVPIVGAVVGVAAAFFVGIVSFENPSHALLTAFTYLVLTSLEAQIVTPSLLGKSLKMSSVLVFLSICVWGWMWGIIGVFLAVPILISMMMITRHLDMLFPLLSVDDCDVSTSLAATSTRR